MKKLIFIGFVLCHSILAMAQLPENEIRLSAGILQGKMLDKQASPLVYQHQATKAALSYMHRGAKSRFSLFLSPSLGTNLPVRFGERTFGDEQHNYTIASAYYGAAVSFSYLRSINTKSHHIKLFLGGNLENNLEVSDEIANFFWAINIASLKAQLQGEYALGSKHLLTTSISIPMLSAVTRHNYANFPKSTDDTNLKAFFKQGTEIAGPHQLHAASIQAGYRYQLSRHFALGTDWSFQWLSYRKPRPIRTYSNSLLISTAYTF